MQQVVVGSAELPFQQAQGWDVSSWDAEGRVLLGDMLPPAPESLQPPLKPFKGAGPLSHRGLCPSVPGDGLSSLKEYDVHVWSISSSLDALGASWMMVCLLHF